MENIIQKKLFTEDECNYFKSLTNDTSFERSEVIVGNGVAAVSSYRTSSQVKIEINSDL